MMKKYPNKYFLIIQTGISSDFNTTMLSKNSTILITGGTGSFGRAFLNKLIDSKVKEIRILAEMKNKMICERV